MFIFDSEEMFQFNKLKIKNIKTNCIKQINEIKS